MFSKLFFIALLAGVTILSLSSLVYGERIQIKDDETGGDCLEIGFWDDANKTCFVEKDLAFGDQIRIDSDGVTVDGQGHKIRGDGTSNGIYIPSKSHVKIVNFEILRTNYGIFLNNSSNNIISNITSYWNTQNGIYLLKNSHNNTITNNVLGFNIEHGISLSTSDNNLISNNIVAHTKDGIRLKESHFNTIVGNTVKDNRVEGIDFHESTDNLVYQNNVLETEIEGILDNCESCGNQFFDKVGGNHYEEFDEESEGCYDLDSDGFCDETYFFNGGFDNRPYVNMIEEDSEMNKTNSFISSFELSDNGSQNINSVPSWIKNLALWFHEEKISEQEFTDAIQFIVKKQIVMIPFNPLSENPETSISEQQLIKLGLWGLSLTNDSEFIEVLYYMVENSMIQA